MGKDRTAGLLFTEQLKGRAEDFKKPKPRSAKVAEHLQKKSAETTLFGRSAQHHVKRYVTPDECVDLKDTLNMLRKLGEATFIHLLRIKSRPPLAEVSLYTPEGDTSKKTFRPR